MRMREARERGQPFFPWPDLSPDAWRLSLGAIQGSVAEVLAGEAGVHPGAGPARLEAPAGPSALGIAAFTSGTGPLLGFWIEVGRLSTGDDVAQLLLLHLHHGRRRVARLREAVVHLLDALSLRGVVPVVVKGFHTAHRLFPDPGTRPMSDLDLVVEPEQLPVVMSVLLAEGFTRTRHLRRPYTSEWAPPGGAAVPRSLELTHAENPWTLDLHATFDRDFGGVRTVSVVPPEAAATEPWSIEGRELRVLAQPYLPAYLAVHASQELRNLMLVRLVELVWALRRGEQEGHLDPTELHGLLERCRAEAYVYPAFELAERLAPGTVPPDLRCALARAAPVRVRAIIERLRPAMAMRLDAVSLEEQFMWASGPVDHLRRFHRALWPSWAGSLPEMLSVQSARLRQLLGRNVVVHEGVGRPRDPRS